MLGPPGLARDIVTTLLAAGSRVVVGDDRGGDPRPPSVSVLVEPTAADWDAASANGAPVVLVLAEEPTEAEVVDAVLDGADAVVSASGAPESLFRAVEAVLAGGTHLQPVQVRALATAARASRTQASVALTPREREIIASIVRGEGVKQTALALGIAAKTVENLQSRLFRKLDARNRAHAVVRAHALGLIPACAVGAPPTAS